MAGVFYRLWRVFENAGGFKNMKENYNRTLQACFVGYVVQAIVNNFVPLLFLTFQGTYGFHWKRSHYL